jgi:DNA polymerase-1
MEEVVEDARMTGYTTTLFGRRRQLPELRSDNWRVRQMGERMAQNAPIQGTAADLFKKAMLDVDAVISASGFATRMLLNVHDEILFEVPEDEIDDVVPQLVAVMENVYPLRVPLVVDSGIGPNWEACKPTA